MVFSLKREITILLATFAVLTGLSFAGQARAETEIWTTWHAKNYVPASYKGRALPSYKSPVVVTLNLIEDGRPADIRKNEITWVINGRYVQSGTGMSRITFESGRQEIQKIDVTIAKYKNQNISKLIIIPTAKPEIIVDLPSINRTVKRGDNIINALPYFFNVDTLGDINLEWRTFGETFAGSGNTAGSITLNTSNESAGSALIEVDAVSSLNKLESAIERLFITLE